MDCIHELSLIEEAFAGSLAHMGQILATVDDPVEQMVIAVMAVRKFRERNEGERRNFSEQETIWRVGATMRQFLLEQQEHRMLEEAVAYGDALEEYKKAMQAKSDKSDSSKKNKGLQLQDARQLELCLKW